MQEACLGMLPSVSAAHGPKTVGCRVLSRGLSLGLQGYEGLGSRVISTFRKSPQYLNPKLWARKPTNPSYIGLFGFNALSLIANKPCAPTDDESSQDLTIMYSGEHRFVHGYC